ncbi:MAG TPA: response regulator [Bacteroidales bacterium]|nr:response regulator [Bacteroidales bacterium]
MRTQDFLTGRKILIVEDDFSSRLYLNKILEKTGAILLNAGDGREAVNIAQSEKSIDLILMDIQLPLMDGYTAAKKIRENGSEAKIIAQTAYALSGEMENFLANGFDDYIVKPIYSGQLLEKIESLLK